MLLALKVGNNHLLTVLIDNGADINTPSEDVRKSSTIIFFNTFENDFKLNILVNR